MQRLGIDYYMQYAHGPDLCHEADMRHAMANAFEAICGDGFLPIFLNMYFPAGALYLDGGLTAANMFIGRALFPPDVDRQQYEAWTMSWVSSTR
jgi:ribonuclease-3